MFEFLSRKFSGILSWIKDKGRLTEEMITQALSQVKEALIDADVPLEVVNDFLAQVKQDIVGSSLSKSLNPGQQLIKIVHQKLLFFLQGGNQAQVMPTFQIPSVIMMVGLQGSGKTTTISKIAYYLKKEAAKKNKTRHILCASIDFYRPAAIDQLEILAKNVGVDFFRAPSQQPLTAAEQCYAQFKKGGYDYLLLDTAGRLHVDETMMSELKAVTSRLAPRYKLLVLDAMTGQESLKIAQAFNDSIGFDYAILTKMDSDTRGGAAFAFKYSLKKAIAFVGSGEKIDDFDPFVPERMATRILGMGDILTLIEKTEEKIDDKTQEEMSRKFFSGAFTLLDFQAQLDLIANMGSFQKLIKYIPGVPQFSPEMLESGQKELKIFKAIISSMTRKEAECPDILDASRKRRIASGSGTSVHEINKLLERFEQSKQFAKMFKKSGTFKQFFKQR